MPETHACVLNTVSTDALVLQRETTTIHSPDLIFIVFDQFRTEILQLWGNDIRK